MFEKLDKVYCYPDTLQNRYLPQAWQIFIMKNFLENHKKKIDFYTGENHKGYKKMKTFSEKFNLIQIFMGLFFFHYYNFVMIKNLILI